MELGVPLMSFKIGESIKTAECIKKMAWNAGAPDILWLMTDLSGANPIRRQSLAWL
jgi:hypothetical protein